MTNGNSPIIIIGMHRSGTTLITQMLETLGLFFGKRKDNNSEALFFLHLNKWLLSQANAAWDSPGGIDYLLKNQKVRRMVSEHLRYVITTPRIISFLGWKNYVRVHSLNRCKCQWGWKDPRNTYTLPFWLEIFPRAKIIHIYRHGIDVANSLRVRTLKTLEKTARIYKAKRKLYLFMPKRSGFIDSLRCTDIAEAFSLWEDYMFRSSINTDQLGTKVFELKFENFLLEPKDHLRLLADFCGLSASESKIRELIEGIDKNRAYAYQKSEELIKFECQVKKRLSKFGY